MSAPVKNANLVRVIDGLQWILNNKLNADNGYRTDGTCVIRGKDPREYQQQNAKDYAKFNRCVSIRPGDGLKNRKKSLSVNRWQRAISLWCTATLSLEQQRDGTALDALTLNFQRDLDLLIDQNSDLKAAFASLHAQKPDDGYDQTSCIGLKLLEFHEGDGSPWPSASFLAVCMVEFDEPKTHL